MGGFVAFLKSDVGFLRALYPNEGLGLSVSIMNKGWPSPDSGYFSDQSINLMDNPAGSIMYPLSSSEYNSTSVGGDKTLFGFYLYDANDRFTNRVYRVNFRRGQYNSSIRGEIYDIASETVISSQVLSSNLYPTTNYSLLFAFTPGVENDRPVLWCTAANRENATSGKWRCQDNRFRIWMDAGTGSIIPANSYTHHQVITDPNQQDPGGISGESGGDGDFDPSSDIITRPSISVINGLASANAGFITLYKITMPELQLLASYLYTDNIWQIVSNYFSHPSDMIAGLLLVPVAVTTGQSYKPKVGLHTFEITLPIVTEQYYDIDMGNLTISEYYGSCFDYAPYTQIEIYLPFIGTRSLDVDEVMGKTLHLSYRIDVLNGDCVATISYYDGLNRSVRYEFSGNCGQQIPVSAQNMDAVVQNAIAFATTAVTAIAGAAGAGAAAASAATEAGATAAEIETISTAAQASANLSAAGDIAGAGVGAVMNSKAHIERTGNIGSGLGLLSVLTPYIVKKIPRQSLPDGYANFEGYPANIYGTLAEFSGYTVVDEIKLQNISATDGELAEIYNILKGGVYL